MFRIDLASFDSYTIEGRTIIGVTGRRTSRYILPTGARISVTLNNTTNRGVLEIGGYKTLTCTVSGPADDINRIWEFIL